MEKQEPTRAIALRPVDSRAIATRPVDNLQVYRLGDANWGLWSIAAAVLMMAVSLIA